jgi:hypothetical protein
VTSILQKGRLAFCALGALLGASVLAGAEGRPARSLTIAVPLAYEGACEAAPPAGTVRLWLGHFRGGNAYRAYDTTQPRTVISVEWAEQYQCFSTRQRCEVWQARLRHIYRRIEGARTCLPLR